MALVPGCAGGVNGARQGLANAALVQAKIYKTLVNYDATMQKNIVDEAIAKGHLDEGTFQLAEYRGKRKIALEALQYSSGATLAAEAALAIGARAKTGDKDAMGWIAEVATAMVRVYQALEALGWKRIGLGGIMP